MASQRPSSPSQSFTKTKARNLLARLRELMDQAATQQHPWFYLRNRSGGPGVKLSGSELQFFIDALHEFTRILDAVSHNSECSDSSERMVSTQVAADHLNVSRPFFVNTILKKNQFPHIRVGTHYRVRWSHVEKLRKAQASRMTMSLDLVLLRLMTDQTFPGDIWQKNAYHFPAELRRIDLGMWIHPDDGLPIHRNGEPVQIDPPSPDDPEFEKELDTYMAEFDRNWDEQERANQAGFGDEWHDAFNRDYYRKRTAIKRYNMNKQQKPR